MDIIMNILNVSDSYGDLFESHPTPFTLCFVLGIAVGGFIEEVKKKLRYIFENELSREREKNYEQTLEIKKLEAETKRLRSIITKDVDGNMINDRDAFENVFIREQEERLKIIDRDIKEFKKMKGLL